MAGLFKIAGNKIRTKPLVRCIITEGGEYERGESQAELYCYVDSSGKMVVRHDKNARMFILPNSNYKSIEYNGYLKGDHSIVMVDSSNNVVDSIKAENGGYIVNVEFAVPANCKTIYITCDNSHVDDYYLRTFLGNPFDVSDCIDDWESLEVTISRDGTSGAMSEVSFPVNLVLRAREFVKDIFDRNALYSKALLSIYRRGDTNANYTLIKETPLDFSTYKEYEDRVTIETIQAELAEIINSEGKTKYEVPVADVKESKPWLYQRITFMNLGKYELATDTPVTGVQAYNYVALPMTMVNSEQVPGEETIFKDERLSPNKDDNYNPIDYFFRSFSKEDVTVNISIDLSFESYGRFSQASGTIDGNVVLAIYKFKDYSKPSGYEVVGGPWTLAMSEYSKDNTWAWAKFKGDINDTKFQVTLKENECLSFVWAFRNDYGAVEQGQFTFTRFGKFQIDYMSKSKQEARIDIISPSVLLQKYVDMMTGQEGRFHASIDWQEDFDIMIVAAESIRRIEGAKLYGSPNDFFDWMNVLGYEYKVDGRKLTFRRRDEFFKKNVTAMRMREDEVADLIIQSDGTYAYTSVEIGYDKQDYDSINGRCEANGTFAYTTGYVTRDDNKLSLVSPYRADSIGIELLCQETDKETTDKDSDNDVFFIAVTSGLGRYLTYEKQVIEDIEIGLNMFNAPFNPYNLVKRNESLIGINTNKLKFKSTDMSRTAQIVNRVNNRGFSPYVDQAITKKLFDPIEYNFAAGSQKDLPAEAKRDGVISVAWNDKTYTGFIKQIRKNYAAESETTWVLWAVK